MAMVELEKLRLPRYRKSELAKAAMIVVAHQVRCGAGV